MTVHEYREKEIERQFGRLRARLARGELNARERRVAIQAIERVGGEAAREYMHWEREPVRIDNSNSHDDY